MSSSTYTLGDLVETKACCTPKAQLELVDISVSYAKRTVVEHISLDIPRGCITALIGPSGCGKTSLLSAINRLTDLLPDCNVAGRVLLDGMDIHAADLDVLSLRRRIGMIFQRPNPFPLSIRRNLDLPLREHGVRDANERARRIEKSLRDVGLWDEVHQHLDSPALRLSGGQQQRLCIARALVIEPDILLMDEPCSALDPVSSGIVEELIRSLGGRYTVVIVTHNLAQARRIANYTAFFWTRDQIGQLIEYGPTEQVFIEPTHALTAAYVNGHQG